MASLFASDPYFVAAGGPALAFRVKTSGRGTLCLCVRACLRACTAHGLGAEGTDLTCVFLSSPADVMCMCTGPKGKLSGAVVGPKNRTGQVDEGGAVVEWQDSGLYLATITRTDADCHSCGYR